MTKGWCPTSTGTYRQSAALPNSRVRSKRIRSPGCASSLRCTATEVRASASYERAWSTNYASALRSASGSPRTHQPAVQAQRLAREQRTARMAHDPRPNDGLEVRVSCETELAAAQGPTACDTSPALTVRLGAMSHAAAGQELDDRRHATHRPLSPRDSAQCRTRLRDEGSRPGGMRHIARCHGETRRNVARGGWTRARGPTLRASEESARRRAGSPPRGRRPLVRQARHRPRPKHQSSPR